VQRINITPCYDKPVAGLGTALAHKRKKAFQRCLFPPTPSSNNHFQAQIFQEAPRATTTLMADEGSLIPPLQLPPSDLGAMWGAGGSLPVMEARGTRPALKGRCPPAQGTPLSAAGQGRPSLRGTAEKK